MSKAKIAGGTVALVSSCLLAFLTLWEGDKQYTVYADKLAGGLPTVCRGLTKHVTKTPIIVGDVWSSDKCHAEESQAIERVQNNLARCFKRTPSQSVFDAASSHAWNFGVGSTCASDAMKAWNMGLWEIGCIRLYESDKGKPVWSFVKTGEYINGKPVYKFVKGLQNRRKAESAMCLGHISLNVAGGDR